MLHVPHTSTPSQRLAELGLTLPSPPRPVASYVPAVRSGNLLFVSGQIPIVAGKVIMTGAMPAAGSIEQAAAAARQCALNALAVAAGELGTIDRIRRVVRVGCFVASEPDFGDQPKVANGASDLLVAVFGEDGRHARAAVGSCALPLNVTVEVEFLFEVA
ncbi:MAG: RidA family protein [Leptolyngbya sp. PLA3]|nr:MAG: RidA family protein [Cyanobacteria bacterium CYA]MCE7969804.1 RidA family protein [Leptolyngbya sp. PL-A3]